MQSSLWCLFSLPAMNNKPNCSTTGQFLVVFSWRALAALCVYNFTVISHCVGCFSFNVLNEFLDNFLSIFLSVLFLELLLVRCKTPWTNCQMLLSFLLYFLFFIFFSTFSETLSFQALLYNKLFDYSYEMWSMDKTQE